MLSRISLTMWATLLLAQHAQGQAPASEVFLLINERLGHMEDVALYKAENNLAVEDLARELIVVENAVIAAESAGLVGSSIEHFFVAQINAAKAIQYRTLADWLSSPVSKQAPDLQTEIRPLLTELGDKIVDELASFLAANDRINESQREIFHQQITVTHVSTADKDHLFNSLLLVRAQSAH